jgi:hypothetical protein
MFLAAIPSRTLVPPSQTYGAASAPGASGSGLAHVGYVMQHSSGVHVDPGKKRKGKERKKEIRLSG